MTISTKFNLGDRVTDTRRKLTFTITELRVNRFSCPPLTTVEYREARYEYNKRLGFMGWRHSPWSSERDLEKALSK